MFFFSADNWIALTSLFVTTLTTISSIIISTKTLLQNSKMIEESTRPVIMFYKDTISINTPTEYLVLQNFGNSPGTIRNIIYNEDDFRNLCKDKSVNLTTLRYFKNITLAPHQKYMFPINSNNLENKVFKINLEYKSSTKNYYEEFSLNLAQDYSITFIKQNKSNTQDEIKTISNSMQELINRL